MSIIQKAAITSAKTSPIGLIPIADPIVNQYNDCKKLNLTGAEKNDLVEYLKSL